MGGDVFTTDFKASSYWADLAGPPVEAECHLPEEVEVLIIGGGYTGLNAALQTAQAGRETLVVDAGRPGMGCSLRNGGQLSTSLKPSFALLKARYGEGLATDLCREAQASLDYMHHLADEQSLEIGLRKTGRFHGAYKRTHYDRLSRECAAGHPVWQVDAHMVPEKDMALELGTDAYFGGIVYPHHCSIDVSKYHPALLQRAVAAGALVKGGCAVLSLDRLGTGFKVVTQASVLKAGKVILATNGYTGPLTSWHQRRIIPIGSYVIATEEIPQDTIDRLFPTDRILSDTRKLVYYYRLSPDRKRVLFGGRVSLRETDPRNSAVKLHRDMSALFPDLRNVRISHAWAGFVGYTFDTLAHCGEDDGLYYAMGYCGSGVGMASYLGMRIGRKAAGLETTPSAFERISYPTRPLYSGNPWFLAPSVMVYRLRDRFGI